MSHVLEQFRMFFANETDYMFWITILLISSWLFNDNKKRFENHEIERNKKIDYAIENYYKLMCYIKPYIYNATNDIPDDIKNNINFTISNLLPYISRNFTNQLINWEDESLNHLHEKLKQNIQDLKYQQNYSINQEEITITNFISNWSYICGLKVLFISAINVFITMLILSLLFLSFMRSHDKNLLEIIYIHIPFAYLILISLILITLVDNQTLKKWALTKFEWLILYLIVFCPIICIYILDVIKIQFLIKIMIVSHMIILLFIPKLAVYFANKK